MNSFDRFKQKLWRGIYPHFTNFQKFFLKMGFHQKGRQKYHVGWMAPGKTLEEMKRYLHEKWGFGNHFVAWTDDDQVLSWRKLADFQDQYHLRVYKDGEICGHFEYTPEAHPVDHFIEKGEIEKKEDFLKFLGEYCVQEKYISNLVMDPDAYNPDSELTIDQINK